MKNLNKKKLITQKQKNEIISKNLNKDNTFILDLDGNIILNQKRYDMELYKHMNLPISFSFNLDAYSDSMRDTFSYYDKNNIIILISNYKNFLKEDKQFKKNIEKIFDEDILPWFEEDYKKYGDKEQNINYIVYIVE